MDFVGIAADRLVARATPKERVYFPGARSKQIAPDDPRHAHPDADGAVCGCHGVDTDWNVWMIMAGRGWGKSAVGSQWIVDQAMRNPGGEYAILAPTFRDTRKTCIEGTTGVLAALNDGELSQYRRNELQILLTNGSVIYGYSADQPERIRGANLSGCWADELGSWRYEETWHAGLVPALRKGENPRVVVTTTPRPTALVRDLMGRKDGSVHVTRGSTWENARNLSAVAIQELKRRYEGTRLGRQELEGELLDDIEGALWSRADIDATRVGRDAVPDLIRVVVGVDPAVTNNERSDETGIVVVGEARDGHAYVLADRSLKGTPNQVMNAAVRAYHEFDADHIVGEVNQGGQFVETVLRTIDPEIPYKAVRATRGKEIRAEPVAALYEQHRVHHLGSLPELEDQLCTWVPHISSSPDHLDALVWAITELRGLSAGSWSDAYGMARCGGCQNTFVSDLHPQRCPRCGAPRESAA